MAENAKEPESITLQMIDDSFNAIKKGEIVKGSVVNVTDTEVMIDIGYKSEGIISLSEFEQKPELFSTVSVYISSIENSAGKIQLSKRIADQQRNFQNLMDSFKESTAVEGDIVKLVNGGFFVEIDGCKAFLPGSLVDSHPVKNYEQFVGQKLNFKIINIDKKKRNIIVSRKKYLQDKNQHQVDKLLDIIEVGKELDGVVKNLTNYGAFVDLGGVDGLVHVSDMSWGEIKRPSDMLRVGDRIKVKVIAYDPESKKISLGIKQLVPEPWETIEKKYSQGDKVTGTVVNIENYGAFVEVETGVKGLIHKSELSWTKKIFHPKQVLKVGDKISAIILYLSKEEKKMSLGLKQMTLNPWLKLDSSFEVGQVIEREIKSITSFGLFLELADDIDGLVHITDISWTKRVDDPEKNFQIGQKIKVKILDINKSLHKVSFGIKQLTENPWETMEQILPIDSQVEALIVKVVDGKGLVLDFCKDEFEFEGFCPISFLALDNKDELVEKYVCGSKMEFSIYEIDKQNSRIILKIISE